MKNKKKLSKSRIYTDTPPPADFTGITTGFGGAINSWSCLGGSRLILSKKDGLQYRYIRFDCTKKVNINFSTDLSGINCGNIAAFYMVPMAENSSKQYKSNGVEIQFDETGTLYNDAQGIGYVTPNSGDLNDQRARTELDLLETSGRAAQTTIHAALPSNDATIKQNPNR